MQAGRHQNKKGSEALDPSNLGPLRHASSAALLAITRRLPQQSSSWVHGRHQSENTQLQIGGAAIGGGARGVRAAEGRTPLP
jgi:hypothetical protein